MTDFIIFADEDWPQTFIYQDSSGDGIDIADGDLLFVASSGVTVIKKSTTHYTITKADQSALPGVFTVLLSSTDTTSLGGKTFSYEIKLTIDGVARVIYPAPGTNATFNVLVSLTDGVTP